MDKTRNRINKELDYIDFEIEEIKRTLSVNVELFKAWVTKSDADTISRMPSHSLFENIQSDVITIERLREKKRWLVSLLGEWSEENE